MKQHKKPRYTEARNLRKQSFKYYYIDDVHKLAVKAGRCYKCNKVTDAFCDKCNVWICQTHMVKSSDKDYECYCRKCHE